MKLENKVYSKKELKNHYLKLKKTNEEIITYGDNIGNLYHFIKVEEGLEFQSMEKNQVKIMLGFHEK
ncbi:hypothetical protein LCGC14_2625040 [marine sediment metagenome]|uniref:Uncharacterized protein n=1 Tax=marine sediment metagenome TaxID=412755 RepID=A0A0F9A213_9ZZZZ